MKEELSELLKQLFDGKIIYILDDEKVKRIMTQPNVRYVFAREDSKIIGMTAIYVVELFSRKLAVIEEVVTLEDCRNKGIGSKMVKQAIEVAKASGCDCVELCVRKDKGKVKKFYEDLGFKDRSQDSMRLWINKK